MALPDRDFVRELLSDSDRPYKVSDDFIDRVLVEEGNPYLAAARAAWVISTKRATAARSKSIGGLSVSYANESAEYAALAKSLEKMGNKQMLTSGKPYAGGLDADDVAARREDTSTLQTSTRLGMHERPDPGTRGGVQQH